MTSKGRKCWSRKGGCWGPGGRRILGCFDLLVWWQIVITAGLCIFTYLSDGVSKCLITTVILYPFFFFGLSRLWMHRLYGRNVLCQILFMNVNRDLRRVSGKKINSIETGSLQTRISCACYRLLHVLRSIRGVTSSQRR